MARAEDSRFGPNLWLMQEMHERYVKDPSSVSEAWRDFFHDYPAASEAPSPSSTPPARAGFVSESLTRPGPSLEDGATLSKMAPGDAFLANRMQESLEIPTATSVRVIPARLLEVNRQILNNHQGRYHRPKVSFTHILGWAVVKALTKFPDMNVSFAVRDGKPHLVRHPHINLGLAVDIERPDGTRILLVPNVKAAEVMNFASYHSSYEDVVRKARSSKLAPDDFGDTTITVTNPGTFGTVQSVPRLMPGQGAIIGMGAIAYPAEFEGADPQVVADIGVGKVFTLSSTYDHRVIQGALSGQFLAEVHNLLIGKQEFYEEIFTSLGVPYVPVQWREDQNPRSSLDAGRKQARVFELINSYRSLGHLIADLDPLAATPPFMHRELDPWEHGFTLWDLDRRFPTGKLAKYHELPLGLILKVLRDAYCRTTGIEYMHILEPKEKAWIQERVEGVSLDLSAEDHRRILEKLNQAESFETFLHTKFVGHKRFSLEGALSLVPMLDAILSAAITAGLQESVIGMSHRGRLNVLANIVGRSYREIFREFEGKIDPQSMHGSGDVRYHLGAEGLYIGPEGDSLPVSMVSNPSHLESVDPVVEGVVRAKVDMMRRWSDWPVLPILIHGDAAFAGQGVVAETLNLSQLSGYRTGGTLHVVVNNQLGFTAAAGETRSSKYASDIAKMIQAPIFHVNGDDPEACVRSARLAFDFRQKFQKDVVVDMWCYRRWGHNEVDDPSYTQPIMYRRIEAHRSVRKLYTEALLKRGDLTMEEAEGALEDFRRKLQEAFDATASPAKPAGPKLGLARPRVEAEAETAVGLARLTEILEAICRVPDGFAIHPKLRKWLEARSRAFAEDKVDWPLAESLAMGALLMEGTSVRLVGQDTRRGTFSQRHAVLVDQNDGRSYFPLDGLCRHQARLYVHDSLLSEAAALGFEYGYSTAAANSLTVWEAQFGDFANGAQVIIDQFIAAGEEKWDQVSDLVMLLPHGYEGQGPEHSSARMERFLTLGAEDNMRVVVPSTPGQFFHLLVGQARFKAKKPLVVFTPKSTLRLPAASSGVLDLISGGFRRVLPDPLRPEPASVRRVILCSGKVYYDLRKAQQAQGINGLAIVRIEQLYPFPADEISEEVAPYENAEVMWVQEEPQNMGAWRYLHEKFLEELKLPVLVSSRQPSASPATGSASVHEREQQVLVARALAGLSD
jgi:2-oxoglutarate decarboxylase